MLNFEGVTEVEHNIIRAAVAEFTAKGFDGARMQRIADAAEVNKALLHYYFRNKQQLYDTAVGRLAGEFRAGFAILLDTERTLVEKIEEFVLHYHTLLRQSPQLTAFFAKQLDYNTLPSNLFASDNPLYKDFEDGKRLGMLRSNVQEVGLLHILSAVFFPIQTFGLPPSETTESQWHDQLDAYYSDLPKRLLDALRQ